MFYFVQNAMASLSKNSKHGDVERTRKFKIQFFVIFRPLSFCVEKATGFDVKVSFVVRPVSHLAKPGDKNFKKRPLVSQDF